MAVTSVSFRSYALGSVGMLPGVIGYAFIGTLIGSTLDTHCGTEGEAQRERDSDSAQSQANRTKLLVLSLGIVSTVLAVFLVSYYSRKALNAALEPDSDSDSDRRTIINEVESPVQEDSEEQNMQTFSYSGASSNVHSL